MDSTLSDFEVLKGRMKATWMSGDYGRFATYLEPGALEILAQMQIATGTKMLDVGCGAGQVAIPAARAGVDVTGVDIATNLIEHARAWAVAEGLTIQFDEGDAEELPYPDASFDTVVSLIGAMFAPRPERVASELVRVCRSGGRIIMANWTPAGFVGQMFKVVGKHVPPPVGVPPAVLWGDENTVRERLGDGVTNLQMTRRIYPSFKYPFGVPEVVEFYRRYYGPTHRAFAALDEDGQVALRHELEELWASHNRATDGTTFIEPEYLEVIAVRR
jgi:SAM-dependent methyltransferase